VVAVLDQSPAWSAMTVDDAAGTTVPASMGTPVTGLDAGGHAAVATANASASDATIT